MPVFEPCVRAVSWRPARTSQPPAQRWVRRPTGIYYRVSHSWIAVADTEMALLPSANSGRCTRRGAASHNDINQDSTETQNSSPVIHMEQMD